MARRSRRSRPFRGLGPSAGEEEQKAGISLGKLYKEIVVTREFEVEKEELVKRVHNRFVRYCKWCYKKFPGLGGKAEEFVPKFKGPVEFLDWDIKAREFNSAMKFTMYSSFFILGALAIALYFMLRGLTDSLMLPLVDFGLALVLGLYMTYYIQNYPIIAATNEKIKALTYIPEVLGYLIMSMKLSPNLEKAVEFAAENSRGKIAEDFKKLLWNVQIGVFNTLSEGLDRLAYRWGKFSDEFKHGLMMIRSSTLEADPAERFVMLDKTMIEVLESITTKMENYARSLSQPSTMLFYLGVLLPLILIVILPVGSAFSGSAMAGTWVLAFIYCILVPLGTYAYAKSILKKRPPTYIPPVIPDYYPGLPPKGKLRAGKGFMSIRFLMIVIIATGFGVSWIAHTGVGGLVTGACVGMEPGGLYGTACYGFDNTYQKYGIFEGKETEEIIAEHDKLKSKTAELEASKPGSRELASAVAEQVRWEQEHDVTPYFLLYGVMISLSLAASVYLYFNNKYKFEMQKEVVKMESDFQDSLYVLASRLGDNRPVEDAMAHTRDFLPDSTVSEKIFGKTIENISLLGLPLEAAVFDKNYGSLRYIPSNIIKGAMRLMVDSVGLGVNVAARTLISLSMQLRSADKVTKMLHDLVSNITSMMRTMAIAIAPIVLGITTALQKVVIVTMLGIAATQGADTGAPEEAELGALAGGSSFTENIQTEVLVQLASPAEFLFIIGLYVVEVLVVLIFFTVNIAEGENPLRVKMALAKYLPIAITLFILSVVMSNIIVGGMTT